MKPSSRSSMFMLALGVCASGCDDGLEQATVVISYASPPASSELTLASVERKRIEDAFRSFAQRNGYKCQAHIKRIEQLTCRGPRDLRLVFEPSLNENKFIARFSWADVDGRTHEEFMGHILTFRRELGSVVGSSRVHAEDN